MARYIDLDKYDTFDCDVEICDGNYCTDCYYNKYGGAEDVAPIIHAKWVPEENPIDWTDGKIHFECSNCGIYHAPKKCERYCPYCGAKMDKE